MKSRQLIVLSAPSGGGKTTVAKYLFSVFPQLQFSVSATTRSMRSNEIHGKDYFFLSASEFEKKISEGDLLEYETIFGNYYGTLRSEVQRSLNNGVYMIFDVDVKGALSLKKSFPNDAFLLYIAPPNIVELERRLRARQTESEEQIAMRLQRAEMEMTFVNQFDAVIVNNDLSETLKSAENYIYGIMENANQ